MWRNTALASRPLTYANYDKAFVVLRDPAFGHSHAANVRTDKVERGLDPREIQRAVEL
jgi:hypothetical protein